MEGKSKFVGHLDVIGRAADTSSLYIGRRAGINVLSNATVNTFVGTNAGNDNTSGYANSFFGELSGARTTSGYYNSIYGQAAGFNNITGRENSFFGSRAGHNNITGTKNTLIGYKADFDSFTDSLDRAIALGYNALVDCHNCAVIGGVGPDTVYLGIGTTSPISKIQINSDGGSDDMKILFSEDDNPGASLFYEGSAGSGTNNKVHIRSEIGSGDNIMTWKLNGNVGIGETDPGVALDIVGDIHYTGEIMDVSDIRLKENVMPIKNAMSKIRELNGFIYNLVSENNRSAGVAAQDVYRVLPEAVGSIGKGYLGVDYTQLIPLLIEGYKEQQLIIEDQQEQLDSQQSQIRELKALVLTTLKNDR